MDFFKVKVLSIRKYTFSVLMIIGLSFGLTACFGIPDAAPPEETGAIGTVKGKLLDSMSQLPIVGAKIDLGSATDAEGVYSIDNVVITFDGANNIRDALYKVKIDLRNVTSPINMVDTSVTPRYPDYSYDITSVQFSTATSTSTSTRVTYLKENVDFNVGKLAATISGVVADRNTLLPVSQDYTVNLISLGSSGNGVNEQQVGSAQTDANGGFTFANIESFRRFRIESYNLAQTFRGSLSLTAPADGVTRNLSVATNDAILVASTDTLSPTIINVTPQRDADIAPAPVEVIFTFSEPILQTANTSTSPSVATGLYNTVVVNYTGDKASNVTSSLSSNITRSLSWNALFTQLKVTIPTLAPASKYTVDLTPANALLMDLNGNALDNTNDRRLLSFTTNGAITPNPPGLVTVVNNASINYDSTSVVLDWLPVSGAKAYNVYRATSSLGATGQLQLIGGSPSTLISGYTDTLPANSFIAGQNKLSYTYQVRSVSADNIESDASPEVIAQDTIAPTATIPNMRLAVYTITFSEPVSEVLAVNPDNYILTMGTASAVPSVMSAVLNAGLNIVTLTLNATIASGNVLTVTKVRDIAGNEIVGVPMTFN
jgi:Bacterial Ig-like domain